MDLFCKFGIERGFELEELWIIFFAYGLPSKKDDLKKDEELKERSDSQTKGRRAIIYCLYRLIVHVLDYSIVLIYCT